MKYQVPAIPFEPVAAPGAIVQDKDVRFTVLTNRIIRMERDPARHFEDRPSQVFWFRKQPVPAFESEITNDSIKIKTDALQLVYKRTPAGFTPQTLSIELTNTGAVWHFGDRDHQNLRGTGRTLDEADGAIHLEQGLISRSGWALVDDSNTLVFNAEGWLDVRPAISGEGPQTMDLYFFGYEDHYLECLKDYSRLAGKVPVLPRWVLGNWWSRYWKYSDTDLKKLMTEFMERDIPLSVCIVDMDWHITQTGNFSSGWTGYTWNKDYFPNPKEFVDWLHQHNLRTALNLHPAEGIHPHEEMYPEFARAMGIDPDSQIPVKFDIADPEFAQQYFKLLHNKKESEEGVDFWWMDWQQGVRVTDSKNPISRYIDPLWWLNHLHYYDLQKKENARGFIFSRWGGLGNHRYPIGFSGDTVVSWASLAFQPYFTATASNVAYSWWSHDIGGHMGGIEEGELYTRWVQYGVFSPILRLHSTANPYHDRTPWGHGKDILDISGSAMQLRHQFIPYIYTMSWKNYAEDVPFIQPMYYQHPQTEEAYMVDNQYYFGSELIAAPYTTPLNKETNLAAQTIWLPEGDWYHFFTGQSFKGGRFITLHGDLEDIPVFAPAGAIIPLDANAGWGAGISNPMNLELQIFAGGNHSFTLFEDDGVSNGYQHNQYSLTTFEQKYARNELNFIIHPAEGDLSHLDDTRGFSLNFFGVTNPEQIKVTLSGTELPIQHVYDAEMECLIIPDIEMSPTDKVIVTLTGDNLLSRRDRRPEQIRKLLKSALINTWVKNEIDQKIDLLLTDPKWADIASNYLKPAQVKALQDILKY